MYVSDISLGLMRDLSAMAEKSCVLSMQLKISLLTAHVDLLLELHLWTSVDQATTSTSSTINGAKRTPRPSIASAYAMRTQELRCTWKTQWNLCKLCHHLVEERKTSSQSQREYFSLYSKYSFLVPRQFSMWERHLRTGGEPKTSKREHSFFKSNSFKRKCWLVGLKVMGSSPPTYNY